MPELMNTIMADGPSSNPQQPVKAQLRAWGTWVEGIITAFLSSGGLIYDTKAHLDADLAHPANSMAWVLGDATVANNGVYRKLLGTGVGSWTRVADLPYSFIAAVDAGAGTPNAIIATSSIPLPAADAGALIAFSVFEANVGSPVTVAFNGAAALTIKTNSGNNVVAGGLTAGMVVAGYKSGTTFRLLSDQASAAIQAAAEAAASAAATSAAAAAASAAAINLPSPVASTLLVRNPANSAYDPKPFPEVRNLLATASYVATRTALKALDTTKDATVHLTENGREGMFVWRAGDFSALIALDTQEGVWLKADAIAANAGAWVRQHEGELLPEWFGAVGNAVANDRAAVLGSLAFGFPVLLSRVYAIGSAMTLNNKSVSIRGTGQYISGLLDTGVAAGAYVLSITNTDYTNPVSLRDFSILTDQATVSRGLNVAFGVFDGEFNRLPFRLLMENMEIRGRAVDINGRLTKGFARGVTLKNVIRPQITNVVVAGRGDGLLQANNTYMDKGWELLSDYHATDPYQRASPTDPVFRDCHVYSADKGWSIDGHWEGLIFDHCVSVLVNYCWYAEANNPPGTGGIAYPWIVFDNCHGNFFYEGIHIKEYFDVRLTKPLLYKWSVAPVGFVSTAINLINCPRVDIDAPGLVNLTNGIDNQQLNGIYMDGCLGGSIRRPQFSGVTYGVQLANATADVVYDRGTWRDLPGFGPTPIEYQDLGTGANNGQRDVPLEVTATNAATNSITTAQTDLVTLDLGTVWKNDEIVIDYTVTATKDATAAPVSFTLSKSAGTSAVQFYGGQTFAADSLYALGGLAFTKSGSVRAKITASGTCTIKLQAACVAGAASVAINGVRSRVVRPF
ncbi:hypothetical protein [Mesorhizobium sp. B2-3-4]|uniref:hypothetical protein n=1 Tax=Mesorhizobium sp. B2-3-4 TaxID=2589959 RepID=UPI001127882D|nr:hypothetical protein [Mesorhizobium sp. B2-3-4]TPM41534.1 hypothetical protein FJ967_00955 [Mesorhizobium sp. B2-3-4]